MPDRTGDALFGYSRVLIYGVTGAGKTSFAARLSERTGLPWTEVDQLTWEPNWVEVIGDEQRRRITEVCNGNEWIIDSAYGRWIDIPLNRVDLIIGLDYPRWLSLFRLIRRTLARSIDGRPICNGNRESLAMLLARDSIVRWHFRSFDRKRERMRAWKAKVDGPDVILFGHPREAEKWLSKLSTARTAE